MPRLTGTKWRDSPALGIFFIACAIIILLLFVNSIISITKIIVPLTANYSTTFNQSGGAAAWNAIIAGTAPVNQNSLKLIALQQSYEFTIIGLIVILAVLAGALIYMMRWIGYMFGDGVEMCEPIFRKLGFIWFANKIAESKQNAERWKKIDERLLAEQIKLEEKEEKNAPRRA